MTESRTKERTEGSSVAASAPAADSVNVRATTVQTAEDWWYVLDQRVHACIKMWLEGEWWGRQRHVMTEAMGEVLAKEREKSHEAITKLTERVIRVEAAANFEERFNRLAHEIKRGSEIPQSESLKKIDALQRQLNELKTVIGLDERVRELADASVNLRKLIASKRASRSLPTRQRADLKSSRVSCWPGSRGFNASSTS